MPPARPRCAWRCCPVPLPQVRLRARHTATDPSAVALEVVDTGVGIAPEDVQRLFQAFVQADNTTAEWCAPYYGH